MREPDRIRNAWSDAEQCGEEVDSGALDVRIVSWPTFLHATAGLGLSVGKPGVIAVAISAEIQAVFDPRGPNIFL